MRPIKHEDNSDVIDLVSDSDDERAKKKWKGKKKEEPGKVELTRQLKCDELVVITEIPTCWTVSHPDHSVAYLLDLSSDKREWKDSKDELMSMAAIIKSQVRPSIFHDHCTLILMFCQDQDAWGGGTAGSKKNAPKVKPLDDQLCQRADHDCQGVWHCNQIDPTLLSNCVRYKPDPDQRHILWDAELAVNDIEGESVQGIVAM